MKYGMPTPRITPILEHGKNVVQNLSTKESRVLTGLI